MPLEDYGGDDGPPRGLWLSPLATTYLLLALGGLVLIVAASVIIWILAI